MSGVGLNNECTQEHSIPGVSVVLQLLIGYHVRVNNQCTGVERQMCQIFPFQYLFSKNTASLQTNYKLFSVVPCTYNCDFVILLQPQLQKSCLSLPHFIFLAFRWDCMVGLLYISMGVLEGMSKNDLLYNILCFS